MTCFFVPFSETMLTVAAGSGSLFFLSVMIPVMTVSAMMDSGSNSAMSDKMSLFIFLSFICFLLQR